jgi:hypothetical protein
MTTIQTELEFNGKKMTRKHSTLVDALRHVDQYPSRSVFSLRINNTDVTLCGDTERAVRVGEMTPAEAAAECLANYEYKGSELVVLERIAAGDLVV